jgi:DNA-binding LytR/AlgR family response regulator
MDPGSRPFPPPPPAADEVPAQPPRPAWTTRIPVHAGPRIVIVPAAAITHLEAQDNYVRIWAGRPYLRKETLTSLVGRLDPASFLRIHRSHAVNLGHVRELAPRAHGEFSLVLSDGTRLASGRSYSARLRAAFGLDGAGARGRSQAERSRERGTNPVPDHASGITRT